VLAALSRCTTDSRLFSDCTPTVLRHLCCWTLSPRPGPPAQPETFQKQRIFLLVILSDRNVHWPAGLDDDGLHSVNIHAIHVTRARPQEKNVFCVCGLPAVGIWLEAEHEQTQNMSNFCACNKGQLSCFASCVPTHPSAFAAGSISMFASASGDRHEGSCAVMWRDASWSCFCILRLIKQQLAMHGWYIQNLQSRKVTPDQDLWLLACQAAYRGKHGWKTLRGRQSREHKIIRLDSGLARPRQAFWCSPKQLRRS